MRVVLRNTATGAYYAKRAEEHGHEAEDVADADVFTIRAELGEVTAEPPLPRVSALYQPVAVELRVKGALPWTTPSSNSKSKPGG